MSSILLGTKLHTLKFQYFDQIVQLTMKCLRNIVLTLVCKTTGLGCTTSARRLCECCRPVQTEVISNSRNKLHQTWLKPCCQALDSEGNNLWHVVWWNFQAVAERAVKHEQKEISPIHVPQITYSLPS